MTERTVGRPKAFQSPEAMQVKIDAYFKSCDEGRIIMDGKVVHEKPCTVSGLCIDLGVCRDTLTEYGKLQEYSATVKFAKLRIENSIECKAMAGQLNPAVSIFNLKHNFGWKDQSYQEVTQKTISNKEQEMIARHLHKEAEKIKNNK